MSKRHVKRTPKRRERPGVGALPKDLYSYAEVRSLPPVGRPPKFTRETWTVTDNWPDILPVTETEIDLFDAWFDELFGPTP